MYHQSFGNRTASSFGPSGAHLPSCFCRQVEFRIKCGSQCWLPFPSFLSSCLLRCLASSGQLSGSRSRLQSLIILYVHLAGIGQPQRVCSLCFQCATLSPSRQRQGLNRKMEVVFFEARLGVRRRSRGSRSARTCCKWRGCSIESVSCVGLLVCPSVGT